MKFAFLPVMLVLTLSASAQNLSPGGNATVGGSSGSQTSPSPNNPIGVSVEVSPYAVIERGANHRIWQRVTSSTSLTGETVYHTNSYTELATGLHYWNGNQWAESSDQIQITPNGAAATNGQHQVNFAANLNTAVAIDLATPDGKHLQSHVVGLAYFDSVSSNSVMFAQLQDRIGQLLSSSNQVVYTNAFTDVDADVRYTYKRNGFEQDIILRQQPPSPADYGLNPQTTRLQIWTEFVNPPEPVITSQSISAPIPDVSPQEAPLLSDNKLDFGVMKFGRGDASSLGGITNGNVLVPVAKQWVHIDGRTFLIEEVYFSSVASQLQSLPTAPSANTNSTGKSSGQGASIHLQMPPPKQQASVSQPMRLAQLNPSARPGVLLDYQTVSGSLTGYTFQADTTYYVSAEIDLYGTNIIEGGAVLKCGETGGDLVVVAGLLCQTAPYRPAIFTCTNDNSVGETISGSTGTPHLAITSYLVLQNGGTISNMFFRYAFNAFSGYAVDVEVWDSQFFDCNNAITVNSGTTKLGVHNVLITMDDSVNNSGDFLGLYPGAFVIYSGTLNMYGENVTADLGSQNLIMYFSYSTSYTNTTSFAFTNSILITPHPNPMYQYGSPPTITVGTNTTFYASSLPSGIFQSVGAGNHYLADGSPYRSFGNTNISSGLLADLKTKTTFPPVILSNIVITSDTVLNPQAPRDTAALPDLGYHYYPLDFIADTCVVSNATLTITNGAAIAFYNEAAGLWLQNGSSLVAIGTPLVPNWFTHYQNVQEQPIAFGSYTPTTCIFINPFHSSTAPNGTLRFCKFSGETATMIDDLSPSFGSLSIQDCEFWAGGISFEVASGTASVNNCLFVRSMPTVELSSSSTVSFTNNLIWCASFTFETTRPTGSLNAFNNIFDTCTITTNTRAVVNGYNAYLNSINQLGPSNGYDIVTNVSLTYQAGPLGTFYQTNTSILIDKGSTNANVVGLYHYTTQTNQVKEANSFVDIGYHYVAVNSSGNPDDTDGDGLADYLEDSNGNGNNDVGIDLSNWTVANSDADGANGLIELIRGRSLGTNAVFDTSGVINLNVYTPLK